MVTPTSSRRLDGAARLTGDDSPSRNYSAALIVAAYHREAGQRRQAEAVSQFLVDALSSPWDPSGDRSYNPKITVADVLDRAVRELQDKFSDDPLTKRNFCIRSEKLAAGWASTQGPS